MTDKLDPTAWAHTGDDEYDEKHKTVLPDEDQVYAHVKNEYGLPSPSARAFTAWLVRGYVWTEFADPAAELPVTVDQVIAGAVEHWCGGRTR